MLGKRKGLFGSPGTTAFAEMVQGVGTPDPMTNQPVDLMQAPEMKPAKPGFNDPGGWGEKLAMIGSVLAGDGGNSPALAPYILRRQQELLAQRQQQDREYDWQDWQRKQKWERANPKPVNNDTTADYDFRKRILGEDAAKDWLRSSGDPIVTVPLPNGQIYSGPRSQLSVALTGKPVEQQAAPPPVAATSDAPTILKNASARGYILPEEEAALRPQLGANGTGAFEGWVQSQKIKRVTRTGRTADGRKVIQFTDGTMQYAD